MSVNCPKCGVVLEVKLTAAPPMQAQQVKGKLGDLIDQVDMHKLNAYEEDFMTTLVERYEKYGERIQMSEKQMGVLNKIIKDQNK